MTPWSWSRLHGGTAALAISKNAAGFDVTGRKLWTAEHPTNETVDAYVETMEVDPLVLWSFACFRCTIDPTTGKLLDSVSTK